MTICECVSLISIIYQARDESRGHSAISALKQEGLEPKFHQLDVQQPDSIKRLADFLHHQYAGLDVLINNAGVSFSVRLTIINSL